MMIYRRTAAAGAIHRIRTTLELYRWIDVALHGECTEFLDAFAPAVDALEQLQRYVDPTERPQDPETCNKIVNSALDLITHAINAGWDAARDADELYEHLADMRMTAREGLAEVVALLRVDSQATTSVCSDCGGTTGPVTS